MLHVPYSYPPDPPGGTEVYVQRLIQQLRSREVEAAVAAPGAADSTYKHDGVRVHRFEASIPSLRQIYSYVDQLAQNRFRDVLLMERPDLVHLHALTPGASPGMAAEANAFQIPVVFSYHTPAVTCQRTTLVRWGTTECDGVLRERTCAACTLNSRSVPRPLSNLLSIVPRRTSSWAISGETTSSLRTALGMRDLTALRHKAIRDFLTAVDHIFAMAPWACDVLGRNGVPREKITVLDPDISSAEAIEPPPVAEPQLGSVRLVWLGRATPTKGLHVVVEALLRKPRLPVKLDAYALVQGEQDSKYLQEIRERCSKDSRIRLLDSISNDQVVKVIRLYDAVVIPSQTFETGPLVAFEAASAGLPILASRLPAMSSRIREIRDGILVDFADASAWARAIEAFVDPSRPKALPRPTTARADSGVEPVIEVYRRVTTDKASKEPL